MSVVVIYDISQTIPFIPYIASGLSDYWVILEKEGLLDLGHKRLKMSVFHLQMSVFHMLKFHFTLMQSILEVYE